MRTNRSRGIGNETRSSLVNEGPQVVDPRNMWFNPPHHPKPLQGGMRRWGIPLKITTGALL